MTTEHTAQRNGPSDEQGDAPVGDAGAHTITRKHLIDSITEATGHKKSAVRDVVTALLDQVIDELAQGNRLEFRDFGVFEVKERAARVAQNPKTLERVPVPPRRTVKFKVGRRMKEAIENGPTTGAAAPASATVEHKPSPTAIEEPVPEISVRTNDVPKPSA